MRVRIEKSSDSICHVLSTALQEITTLSPSVLGKTDTLAHPVSDPETLRRLSGRLKLHIRSLSNLEENYWVPLRCQALSKCWEYNSEQERKLSWSSESTYIPVEGTHNKHEKQMVYIMSGGTKSHEEIMKEDKSVREWWGAIWNGGVRKTSLRKDIWTDTQMQFSGRGVFYADPFSPS